MQVRPPAGVLRLHDNDNTEIPLNPRNTEVEDASMQV
jgi:hypothetical protein